MKNDLRFYAVALLVLVAIVSWLGIALLDNVTVEKAVAEIHAMQDLDENQTIIVEQTFKINPDVMYLKITLNGGPLEARCENRLLGTGLFGMLKCEVYVDFPSDLLPQ